jgi:hypothetical protein
VPQLIGYGQPARQIKPTEMMSLAGQRYKKTTPYIYLTEMDIPYQAKMSEVTIKSMQAPCQITVLLASAYRRTTTLIENSTLCKDMSDTLQSS